MVRSARRHCGRLAPVRALPPADAAIGKLYRAGAGWKADWTFVDDGRVLATWSNEDALARRVIASGADGAADALVRRYAKANPVGEPAIERVVVTGINGSNDFVRLSSWLQSSSVVRGIRPLRATPNSLELELDLLTGLEGFRRVLDDAILVESGANIEGVPPEFQLR